MDKINKFQAWANLNGPAWQSNYNIINEYREYPPIGFHQIMFELPYEFKSSYGIIKYEESVGKIPPKYLLTLNLKRVSALKVGTLKERVKHMMLYLEIIIPKTATTQNIETISGFKYLIGKHKVSIQYYMTGLSYESLIKAIDIIRKECVRFEFMYC